MGLLANIKKLFHRFDLFSAPANLRISGEPEYKSVCGGFISLVVVIGFAVIFANSFLNLIGKMQVNQQFGFAEDFNSSSTSENIMFAIGAEGQDFRQTVVSYQVSLVIETWVNKSRILLNSTQIKLAPCLKQMWTVYGDDFFETFDQFQFQKMLCPAESIQLQGYQGGNLSQQAKIDIRSCKKSSVYCDYTIFNTSLGSVIGVTGLSLKNHDTVPLHFYILDTVPTEITSDKYYVYVLNKDAFFGYSLQLGSNLDIKMGTYQIQTDWSILPYEDKTQVKITSVERISANPSTIPTENKGSLLGNWLAIPSESILSTIKISRSTRINIIRRNFGKIDQMLSYVGGLFGIIMALLYFLMQEYDEINYQLYVSKGSFRTEEGSDEDSFGFFTYLIYKFYQLLNWLNCPPNWETFRAIHETREQIGQEMDIRYIFKKINYLNNLTKILLNEHERLALYLVQAPTREQQGSLRRVFQQSEKFLETLKAKSSKTLRHRKISWEMFDLDSLRERSKIHPQPESNIQLSNITLSHSIGYERPANRKFINAIYNISKENNQKARLNELLTEVINKYVQPNNSDSVDQLPIEKRNSQKKLKK